MFLLYLFLFQHIVIQFVENHVRLDEPVRNHLKYVDVGLVCIVKARGVDEADI